MRTTAVVSIAALGLVGLGAARIAASAGAPGEPEPIGCCAGPGGAGGVSVKPSLTLEGANAVVAAAVAEARSRDAGGAIAVVDDGGHLLAFARLDGTFAAGAEVSIGKAQSAALFRKPTRAFEESIAGGRAALLGVERLTPLQGGVPIVREGHVVGAVGVSGAHSQVEDEQIALAGAAAIASEAPAK